MKKIIHVVLTLIALLLLVAVGFQCTSSKSVEGVWEILGCDGSPTGRHENGFVELNGKFYLFGGRGIKPVEVFDPQNNTWMKLRPTPFEMHHFQAVTLGDTIVVMGCMTGSYPKEPPVEKIYYYLPTSDKWIEGPEIPKHRRRGSSGVVVYNGKVYIVGGIQLGHTSGTVAWFDEWDPKTGTWKELTNAPNIRDHFHAVVVKDKLYCVGGRNTSFHTEEKFSAFFDATIKDVDCYDFKKREWKTLDAKLPVGTAAGGAVYLDNKIYYFGGESAQKAAHSEMQVLDLSTETWSFGSPLARGRHGSAAILFDEKFYIAAGSGNRGGGPELTSIEQYSPKSEWISLFNGHTLEGWQVKCLPEDQGKAYWSVKDNAITCNSMKDKDHNYVWLMNEEEFGDFELRLKFKAFKDSPGNSGVQFRSRYDESTDAPNGGWLDGPQVDIHPPNPFRTGLIYDETREEKRWIYPSLENWRIDTSYAAPKWTFKYADEGWNDMTIIVQGSHVKTIVNGYIITDWDGAGVLDNQAHKNHGIDQSGHIALQLHAKDALKIQFKNVNIKKL